MIQWKQLIYRVKLPPGVLRALPALYILLEQLFPGRWSVKFSWLVKPGGQLVLTMEVRLGKRRR